MPHTCPERAHCPHSCPRSPFPAPPPALPPRCLSASACFLCRRVPRAPSPTISCPGERIPLFPHHRSLLPPPHLAAGCCCSPPLAPRYPPPLPPLCLSFLRRDPHAPAEQSPGMRDDEFVILPQFWGSKGADVRPFCRAGRAPAGRWRFGVQIPTGGTHSISPTELRAVLGAAGMSPGSGMMIRESSLPSRGGMCRAQHSAGPGGTSHRWISLLCQPGKPKRQRRRGGQGWDRDLG